MRHNCGTIEARYNFIIARLNCAALMPNLLYTPLDYLYNFFTYYIFYIFIYIFICLTCIFVRANMLSLYRLCELAIGYARVGIYLKCVHKNVFALTHIHLCTDSRLRFSV